MEEEMGVRLFERSTRRLTLTNEGLLLRRRAEEILELVDKTQKELAVQEELIEGTVSIGCGDLAAVQALPELFRAFNQRYPAVSFDLYTATADYVKERMDLGLTDAGLLLEPINIEKYDYIRLNRKEQWVAVMTPDSPLAKLSKIRPSDLKNLPLILPRREKIKSELAGWFGKDFSKLNILFTSNLPSSSSIMVYGRLAYAIVIQGSIAFWDKEKIVCRPLDPPLTATSVLAWKRRQPLSPAAAKFIDYARTILQAQSAETAQ